MTRLLLVRHAHPASAWDAGGDPGLDDVGLAQAEELAASVAGHRGAALVSSPRRRALETAAPIAAALDTVASIAPSADEIPSLGVAPTDRAGWLREVMARRWTEVEEDLRAWRSTLLDLLGSIDRETILVTHFVAINVAVGAAIGDDRVTCFWPAYASVTELTVRPGRLELVRRGDEAVTAVLPSSQPRAISPEERQRARER